MPERTCVCPECGAPFTTSHPFKKWCSRPCTVKGNNAVQNGKAARNYAARPCPGCGSPFTPARWDSTHCSRNCKRRVLVPSPAQPRDVTCEFCRGTFQAVRSDARFCSPVCTYGARIGGAYTRICLSCSADITGRMGNAEYCDGCAKGRYLDYGHRYRARKRNGAVLPISSRSLRRFRRGRCAYCPAVADTIDHVIPLARGGRHAEGNLLPACRSCNSSKGDKLLIEWKAWKVRARPTMVAALAA